MPNTDPDHLIDILQSLADDLGHPPTKSDVREHTSTSIKTFQSAFGSWNAALKAAGFDIQRSGRRIPNADLIKELRRLADDRGHPPTTEELRKHGRYSISPYRDRFGSWNAALEAAGLEPRSSSRLSRDNLIDELQRLADELGHPPTYAEMKQQGAYSPTPFDRVFDSWNDALEAAGLNPSDKPGNISKQDLIDELQRLADVLGHPPTIDELQEHGQFSSGPYQNRFGSWSDALEAAGFEAQATSRLSREKLIEDLQQFADKLGHPPTLQEQKEQGPHSHTVYYDRFGSWRDALKAAGFEDRPPQQQIPDTDLLNELRRLAEDLGASPTKPQMNELGNYHADTYIRHLDSWQQALEAANLGDSHDSNAETLLTEKDLARTYENGTEDPVTTLEQYREATQLHNRPDTSYAEIARTIGRSASTVRFWLSKGMTPDVVKAINVAEDRNWLPLRSDDRVFKALNPLVAWVFAGGAINATSFDPTFSADRQVHWPVAAALFDMVNIRLRIVGESEIHLRDGGTVLGRILYALGAPRGEKANQELSLPDYLDTVGPHHRAAFARMYLLHRGVKANTGQALKINVRRTASYRQSLRDFLADVIDPSVSLSESGEIFVPATAVRTIAGNVEDPFSGLAARLPHDDDE